MPIISTRAPRHHRLQHGFTLIELLVVVTIIGIMAGLIAINFAGDDPQKTLDREVRRLQAVIEMAQEEAIFSQRDIGIEITETGYRFAYYGIPDLGEEGDPLDSLASQAMDDEKLSFEEKLMAQAVVGVMKATEQGQMLADMAAAGMAMNMDGSQAEWIEMVADPTYQGYDFGDDYELVLEVDQEMLDVTGGKDETDEETKDAKDILEEDEEPIEPAIFILSSGEVSPFQLEIISKDDPNLRSMISGNEVGHIWVGEEDEFFAEDFN